MYQHSFHVWFPLMKVRWLQGNECAQQLFSGVNTLGNSSRGETRVAICSTWSSWDLEIQIVPLVSHGKKLMCDDVWPWFMPILCLINNVYTMRSFEVAILLNLGPLVRSFSMNPAPWPSRRVPAVGQALMSRNHGVYWVATNGYHWFIRVHPV